MPRLPWKGTSPLLLQRPHSPLYTPGLLDWHEARRISGLANGDPASTWPDLMGRHNATQAGALRPVFRPTGFNGLPAVEFDSAATQYMTLDSLATSVAGSDVPYTIICAAYPTSVAANATFFSFGVSTASEFSSHRVNATTGALASVKQVAAASTTISSAVSSGTSPHVYTCINHGTTLTQRVDGVTVNTEEAFDQATFAADFATVGANRRSSVGATWHGLIAAWGIWGRPLSTWEAYKNEHYFALLGAIPGV